MFHNDVNAFTGIGGLMYVNANGDSDPDFTLLDSEPLEGDWRVRKYGPCTGKTLNLVARLKQTYSATCTS